MKFPPIITGLLSAQNNYNSEAFAHYFSETAVVFDEGTTHNGRNEIKVWNERTNAMYKTRLETVDYSAAGNAGTLTVRVSGTFDGSPIVLKWNFEFDGDNIQSLTITG